MSKRKFTRKPLLAFTANLPSLVGMGAWAEQSLIGEWMSGLEARAPRNVLTVATANKLARIAWAVLSSGENYRAASRASAA